MGASTPRAIFVLRTIVIEEYAASLVLSRPPPPPIHYEENRIAITVRRSTYRWSPSASAAAARCYRDMPLVTPTHNTITATLKLPLAISPPYTRE